MDKLPISTSFLMSINFEGLKEVIDFFHKNINILNEKINDLNKRFRGFDEMQNQLNENKIKTESGLRLLGELEQSINNYSQNIMDNSKNILINQNNIEKIKDEVEKIKSDNNDLMNDIKNINSNLNANNNKEEEINIPDKDDELKKEVENIKINNKDNFEKLFKKVDELETKINEKRESESEKQNEEIIDINKEKENINNKNNEKKVEEKEEKKSENIEDNIIYKELSNKINELEQKINNINNINKTSEEKPKEVNLSIENKEIELKNVPSYDKEKKIEENEKEPEIPENNILKGKYDEKLKEIENKIKILENDILSLKLKKDVNISNQNPNIIQSEKSDINLINKEEIQNENEKEEKIDNAINIDEIKNLINEQKQKVVYVDNKIIELMSEIGEIKNKFQNEKFIGNKEFIKFSKNIEIQFKNYDDKINNILSKESVNDEMLKKINMNNSKRKSILSDGLKNGNMNMNELIETLESNFQTMIVSYLKNLDITNNPKILEINKILDEQTNSINDLITKSEEASKENANNINNYLQLLEKTKKEIENNIKTIEDNIINLPSMKGDLDYLLGIVFGNEELEKYKKMSKQEKINEISIGTSIKEDITIHGNYLKKLSEGINKINSRLNNLNKENLAIIKKDLKNESNYILEDFKVGLKSSISKIEDQLRDKVDKLGLDQFWNKINEYLIEEMKQKIDKKEMNKNNLYLKKKIDNLESKISRTFVDTLIDLQMDEAPLLVKKNFREITEQKCASCGQYLQNDKNNNLLGFSLDLNNLGINQHKTFRAKNVNDKDKLPEIKTNLQK